MAVMEADLAAVSVAGRHQDLTVNVVQHVSHHGELEAAANLRVGDLQRKVYGKAECNSETAEGKSFMG